MSYEKVAKAKDQLVIGAKQVYKAIENSGVQEVIVALDADQRVTDKILLAAKEHDVKVEHVDSMKQLGIACGIEVGAATVAIKK